MNKIVSLTRHPLNIDQINLLKQLFGDGVEVETKSVFFSDAEHFTSLVEGQTVAAVVPAHLLMKAMVGGVNTRIITWVADEEARKRNNFACRGLSVFELENGMVVASQDLETQPTVENSFKDNQEFPYGGEPDTDN